MTHLDGLIYFKPGHRLYGNIHQLCTLVACVCRAVISVQKGELSIAPWLVFRSERLQTDIQFPSRGPIELALVDEKPDEIALRFFPAQIVIPKDHQRQTLVPMFTMIASVIFTNFYEAEREWIQSTQGFGNDAKKWPATINFGRVVRNAVSHSGRAHFKTFSAPPVHWHGWTYSPADHGREIIGPEIAFADLIILMIEIADELERHGAPKPS